MTLELSHRQFSSQYDSRVILYERKIIIKLATGEFEVPNKGSKILFIKVGLK